MSADHGGGHGGGGHAPAPKASGGGGGDHGGGAKKGGKKSGWSDAAASTIFFGSIIALGLVIWAPTAHLRLLESIFHSPGCAKAIAREVMARPVSHPDSALRPGAQVKFTTRDERLSPTFSVPVSTTFAVVSDGEYKLWTPTGWLDVPASNPQVQLTGAQCPQFRLEGSEAGQRFRIAVSQ